MKKVLKSISFGLAILLIGGLMGLTIAYLEDKLALPELSGWQFVLDIILAVYLGTIIQTAIHEAGHVIAGLLTGYKFLSYRMFNLHWQKIDGKIQFKRYGIAGTLGQALMIPPQPQNGKIPYLLYNLGGGLANLLTIPLFFSLIFLVPRTAILWLGLAAVGLLFALLNLIPMEAQVPNDGYNIYAIKNHPQGALYFYNMLKIHSDMTQGIPYQEMDDELFLEADNEHLSNPIIFHAVLNKANRLLALGDYQTARDYLTSLDLEKQNLAQIFRILSKVMLSYLDLLCDQTTSVSFDKKDQNYLEALSKSQPMFLIYLYAYHGLVTGDDEKSRQARADFEAMAKTYPFIVDYEDEKSRLGVFEQFIAERKKQDDPTPHYLH